MSIWETICYQREEAINSDEKDYKKFLERTLDDSVKLYFKDSWDKKIPLEYHTEAVGKPIYHPLAMGRVLIYFNPAKLAEKDLRTHSYEWFGMSLETLKDYVKNGWFVIQLNTAYKYNERSRSEINGFFGDSKEMKSRVLYVDIVDDFLPSVAGFGNITLDDALKLEKEKMKKQEEEKKYMDLWKNILGEQGDKYGGVEITPQKVEENYLKLRFLKKYFDEIKDTQSVSGITKELNAYENPKGEWGGINIEDMAHNLASKTYTSFLLYGTPLLYTDGSGYVSVGSNTYWNLVQKNTKNIFTKARKGLDKFIISRFNNKNILYFENIKNPEKILKNHREHTLHGEYNLAKEEEKKIKEMIEVLFCRSKEKGNYRKAIKSFENEAAGAEHGRISIPLSLGTSLLGIIVAGIIVANNVAGALIGLIPLAKDINRGIRNIALKSVFNDKILGVEINEQDLPNMTAEGLKAYKEVTFRVFKVPVTDQDHTNEEITVATWRD